MKPYLFLEGLLAFIFIIKTKIKLKTRAKIWVNILSPYSDISLDKIIYFCKVIILTKNSFLQKYKFVN